MKKRIIVQKTHHTTEYYDASTPQAEAKSYLKMFAVNKDGSCYLSLQKEHFMDEKAALEESIRKVEKIKLEDLPDSVKSSVAKEKENIEAKKVELDDLIKQKALYDAANKGDSEACKRLLNLRRDYVDEGFHFAELH